MTDRGEGNAPSWEYPRVSKSWCGAYRSPVVGETVNARCELRPGHEGPHAYVMAYQPPDFYLVDDEGNVGIVRDATLNARMDMLIYPDRTVRTDYRKHGFYRVHTRYVDGRQTIRHYWEGWRVPWIVWAMFS